MPQQLSTVFCSLFENVPLSHTNHVHTRRARKRARAAVLRARKRATLHFIYTCIHRCLKIHEERFSKRGTFLACFQLEAKFPVLRRPGCTPFLITRRKKKYENVFCFRRDRGIRADLVELDRKTQSDYKFDFEGSKKFLPDCCGTVDPPGDPRGGAQKSDRPPGVPGGVSRKVIVPPGVPRGVYRATAVRQKLFRTFEVKFAIGLRFSI